MPFGEEYSMKKKNIQDEDQISNFNIDINGIFTL